jgi:hypothetical protein
VAAVAGERKGTARARVAGGKSCLKREEGTSGSHPIDQQETWMSWMCVRTDIRDDQGGLGFGLGFFTSSFFSDIASSFLAEFF